MAVRTAVSQDEITELRARYHAYHGRKALILLGLGGLVLTLFLLGIAIGPTRLTLDQIMLGLFRLGEDEGVRTIIWSIRMPNALAALLAGMGLAATGAAMQSVLRNPLASPTTLGMAHAGAFGAAFAVLFLGGGVMQSTSVNAVTVSSPFTVSVCAFVSCLGTSFLIIALASRRRCAPEVLALCGVALGQLFMALTMFLQYFATDVQIAAMVFWTFGDISRAGWREVGVMAVVTLSAVAWFVWNRWNYNALDAGDETARGLGVHVGRVRMSGMIAASLLTAVLTASLGVIGFVGLVCPHMVRGLLGDDHRYLLPGSCLTGAALLLAGDIASRTLFAPHLLPVSLLTAMVGAPMFFYLLVRRRR